MEMVSSYHFDCKPNAMASNICLASNHSFLMIKPTLPYFRLLRIEILIVDTYNLTGHQTWRLNRRHAVVGGIWKKSYAVH